MAKKRSGNPRGNIANLKPFVKGDPRINRKGAPKKLPILEMLMAELLGGKTDDLTDSEMAKVIASLLDTAKGKSQLRVAAAKEILDRAFGKPKQNKDEPAPSEAKIEWHETKTYKKK